MSIEAFRLSEPRQRSRRRLLDHVAGLVPEEESKILLAFDGVLLRTSDVALLFGVSERCIRKWSDSGKLQCVKTPGGHRLFPAQAVADALQQAAARSQLSGNGAQENGSRKPADR